jgi:hypothetical protein
MLTIPRVTVKATKRYSPIPCERMLEASLSRKFGRGAVPGALAPDTACVSSGAMN